MEDIVDKENSLSSSNMFRHNDNCILSFSPIKSSTGNKCDATSTLETNTLICAKFQDNLRLNFGKVSLKSTHAMQFNLTNPDNARTVIISLDNTSEQSDGIIVTLGTDNQFTVEILPQSTVSGSVFWTPSNDCTIRAIIKLRLDGKAPLQMIVQGIAGAGKVRVIK